MRASSAFQHCTSWAQKSFPLSPGSDIWHGQWFQSFVTSRSSSENPTPRMTVLKVGSLKSHWARGQRRLAAAPPLSITWATGLRLVGISPSPQAMICMSRDTVLCRHLDSDKHNTTQHQKAPTCLNKPRKHDIKIKLPTCFEMSRYHYLKTALNFYIPIKSGNWDCKNRNLSIPGKQKQKLHTCHSPLRSQ